MLYNTNPDVLDLMLTAQKEENYYSVCCNENPAMMRALIHSGYAPNFESSDFSRQIFLGRKK